MAINYKHEWDNLIADLCHELIEIDKIPAGKRSLEDEWVRGTIINVLKRMCSLHKVHPRHQKINVNLTRALFED